ncbi:hypothetical protein ES705_20365 [subsurface metagenome]
MKKLITILSLILFATIAMSQDTYVEWSKRMSKLSIAKNHYDFHGLIVKQANEEWKDDYSMVAWEIQSQCKALYDYTHIEKPIGMTEDLFKAIRVKAFIEWTEMDSNYIIIKADWAMILYETKKQIKVYSEIF